MAKDQDFQIKKQKILQWLKAQDIIRQFYVNFKKSYKKSLSPNKCFIVRAFVFERTPEGFNFWLNINLKFEKWYESEFGNEDLLEITEDDILDFMEGKL